VGTAENKAVQRRIIHEVINRKNLCLADELFSEEHELHPEAPGVGRGPEGMKRAFASLHEEFPDVRARSSPWWRKGTWSPYAWPSAVPTRPAANGPRDPRWSSRASPRARLWRVGRLRIPGGAGIALLGRACL
jgi:hypothetical protein